MSGFEIMEKVGLVVKHMLGVVLLCWRRMLRAGLISGGVGFILVEIVVAIAEKRFPTTVLTTVVALFLAFALAYCVMVTVLIDELIIGAIAMLRVLEGDLQGGARALAVATERRAGDAGSGIMRWLGHPTTPPPEPAPIYPRYEEPTETQADIEATDEFTSTLPRPRVDARPVSAGQLPRISWAMEQLERQEQLEQQERQEATPVESQGQMETPHQAEADFPGRGPEPVEVGFAPRPASPSQPAPRPLATSQPAVEGQRSIWSRISKTLVGDVHPPLAELPDPGVEAIAGDDVPPG